MGDGAKTDTPRKGTEMFWILMILSIIFLPRLMIVGAGYLVQKYRFGVPFKETYAYHKEQDELEMDRIAKRKRNNE